MFKCASKRTSNWALRSIWMEWFYNNFLEKRPSGMELDSTVKVWGILFFVSITLRWGWYTESKMTLVTSREVPGAFPNCTQTCKFTRDSASLELHLRFNLRFDWFFLDKFLVSLPSISSNTLVMWFSFILGTVPSLKLAARGFPFWFF